MWKSREEWERPFEGLFAFERWEIDQYSIDVFGGDLEERL